MVKTAEDLRVRDFISMIVADLEKISENEELWIAKSALKFEYCHDRKQFDETAREWANEHARDNWKSNYILNDDKEEASLAWSVLPAADLANKETVTWAK